MRLTPGLVAGFTALCAAGAANAEVTNVAELVVTAERREKALQDVPVAITAFTAEQRDLVGIITIQDMANFTPGLQYGSQQDRISLRGVGRLTNVLAADPGIATYSDGVYTSSTVEAGKTPLFVERVEVLRGPQGTLYGRNSIGGAINVISRRPSSDFYAEVRGTAANYDRTLLEAAVSGPLAQGLRLRLAGNWEKQRKGYFDNVVSDLPSEGGVVDTWFVELQAAFDVGERLEGWAKVGLFRWDNGSGGAGARTFWGQSPYIVDAQYGALSLSSVYGYSGRVVDVVSNGVLSNPATSDPRKFAADTPEAVKLDRTVIFATEWAWHADGLDIKYVGGGTRYRYTLTQDNDGTAVSQYTIPLSPIFLNPGLTPCIVTPSCRPLTVFPQTIVIYREEKEWFSHELTLTSTHDGPLQWLAGVYRYHERYNQPVYAFQPNQPQLATPIRFNGTPAPLNPDRRLFDNRPELEDTSYAVFGQVDWTFLPGWKATFGLRYSHDHKQGAESVRAICFATAACLGGALVEGLGSFTPAIDVTPAIVAAGTPQGTTGPAVADSFGFFTRGYDASWEALSGVAGVQWEPDPDTMVYGRYSRGYKAGGFRVGIDTVLGAFPYTDNESVDAFEVGLKRTWRRVQANVAAFYYDYKDLQVPLVVANLSGGLAVSESRFLNVPEAASYGLELEGVWSPIEPLRITASYGYLHTEVKALSGVVDPNDPTALDARARPLTPFQACTGVGAVATPFNPIPHPLCDINTRAVQRPQDLSGNRLPNSPQHKLALNALYTRDFKGGSLSLSVSYVWRDTQYMGLFTRGYHKSPAWDQVDGRLVWRDNRDRYTAILFVRNLFDTLGYEGGAGAGRGAFERSGALPVAAANVAGISSVGLQRTFPLTPPRTYGIELQFRFGQGR